MFDTDDRSERVRSEALSSRLREHAAHLAAAEYRWLRDLGEFDEIRGWAREGCRSPIQWLSWACGMGAVAARERLRVARALPELPLVSEAFAAGELTYSKARAITRVATPETEELLVGFGRNATASQLERIVRGVRRSAQLDAKAHEAFQRRYVRWYYDDDGSVVIKARLDPTDGATVIEPLSA